MSKNFTKCNSCGNMIDKELKRCPHCDSEIKKPAYKKWWFWLIIGIVVVYDVAILNAFSYAIWIEVSSVSIESSENAFKMATS